MLLSPMAFSQYVAYEPFIYTIGDTIDQTTGNSGDGFSDAWSIQQDKVWGSGCSGVIGNHPLVYGDMEYPIEHIGSHATLYVPGGWQGAIAYQRRLNKVWPNEAGKVYWTSMIFDVDEAPSVDHCYFLFKLYYYGADTSELFAVGKGGGTYNYTCGSGWPGSGGDDVSDVVCEGGPQWLVTATYMSGDSMSRTFMWINPDPAGGEPDTNNANVKRWSRMPNGFNVITMECGGGDSAWIDYDEIRISDTWMGVSLPFTKAQAQKSSRPNGFAITQNYPNPFNPVTQFSYTVPKNSYITLKVYNVLGLEVATLFEGMRQAGTYTATFNASHLASGVYFYRLQAEGVCLTKKMALIK